MKNVALLFEFLAFLLVIYIWGFVILNFSDLPAKIPIHFGASGQPNGFGPRETIWSLPVLSSGIFFLLLYLSRNPTSRFLNLPQKVKASPKHTRFIVQSMNVIIQAMVAAIVHGSVLTALGSAAGLNTTFMMTLIGVLFVTIFCSLFYSWRTSRKQLS